MSGINKVILVGNVGKDPEVKYIEGNIPVAKLSLATSETYRNKDGQKVEQTEWHNVVLWRKLAEVAEKYVRKGKMLYIEGKVRTRTYGEENNKKYFTEIIAESITLLGGPRVDSASNSNSVQENVTVVEPMVMEGGPTGDLPF